MFITYSSVCCYLHGSRYDRSYNDFIFFQKSSVKVIWDKNRLAHGIDQKKKENIQVLNAITNRVKNSRISGSSVHGNDLIKLHSVSNFVYSDFCCLFRYFCAIISIERISSFFRLSAFFFLFDFAHRVCALHLNVFIECCRSEKESFTSKQAAWKVAIKITTILQFLLFTTFFLYLYFLLYDNLYLHSKTKRNFCLGRPFPEFHFYLFTIIAHNFILFVYDWQTLACVVVETREMEIERKVLYTLHAGYIRKIAIGKNDECSKRNTNVHVRLGALKLFSAKQ